MTREDISMENSNGCGWALAIIFAGFVLGWVVGCISAVVAG